MKIFTKRTRQPTAPLSLDLGPNDSNGFSGSFATVICAALIFKSPLDIKKTAIESVDKF